MTLFATASLTAATSFGIPAAGAETIWEGGFETGDLSQYSTNELPKADSGTVISSPRREGGKALKILLRRGDAPGRERAEVKPQAWSKYPNFKNGFALGQEYWYSVSIYLPTDYVIDNDNEIIFQMHGKADIDQGECSMQPPMALGISGSNWYLVNRADARRVVPCGATKQFQKTWTLGPIRRGGWTTWVFRAKWSYGPDGMLQAWKDGELVMSRNGMNTYNDAKGGPYMKAGLYKFTWKNRETLTNRRVLYFDALKIDKGPSSVLAMSPPGTSEPYNPEVDTDDGTTGGDTGSSSTDGTADDSTTGENTDTSPTAGTETGGSTDEDTDSGSTEWTTDESAVGENTGIDPAAAAGGGGGGAEATFYLYLLAMLALARSGIVRG